MKIPDLILADGYPLSMLASMADIAESLPAVMIDTPVNDDNHFAHFCGLVHWFQVTQSSGSRVKNRDTIIHQRNVAAMWRPSIKSKQGRLVQVQFFHKNRSSNSSLD